MRPTYGQLVFAGVLLAIMMIVGVIARTWNPQMGNDVISNSLEIIIAIFYIAAAFIAKD